MIIKRRCPFTGTINEMDIQISLTQLERWQNGELIQRARPNLTPDEREFIMTGITPEQWDNTFPPEEE